MIRTAISPRLATRILSNIGASDLQKESHHRDGETMRRKEWRAKARAHPRPFLSGIRSDDVAFCTCRRHREQSEAIEKAIERCAGLLRRSAPRNDGLPVTIPHRLADSVVNLFSHVRRSAGLDEEQRLLRL